jgi:hypothetical protein
MRAVQQLKREYKTPIDNDDRFTRSMLAKFSVKPAIFEVRGLLERADKHEREEQTRAAAQAAALAAKDAELQAAKRRETEREREDREADEVYERLPEAVRAKLDASAENLLTPGVRRTNRENPVRMEFLKGERRAIMRKWKRDGSLPDLGRYPSQAVSSPGALRAVLNELGVPS